MGYKYSDAQMLLATQVAYLDVPEGVRVGDYVDEILGKYGTCDVDGKWHMRKDVKISGREEDQFNTAQTILDRVNDPNSNLDSSWRNWVIKDVCNDQDKSGLYGCLIDTGTGDAIIGVRGSESYDMDQVINDWGKADFGLLDSRSTEQQSMSEEYMKYLYYKYGDQYDTFSIIGHSLGGNLAMHMAITAPAGMRQKMDHCISFDGPGFSDEYINIKAHKEGIEKSRENIDHYQWSLVGTLLTIPSGIRSTVIKAHDAPDKSDIPILGPIIDKANRHATGNVELQDGQIQHGRKSDLAVVLDPIAKGLDYLPISIAGITVVIPSANIFYKILKSVVLLKICRTAISDIGDIVNKIDEMTAKLYYNYIAPNVSGDYEVNISGICDHGTHLAEAKQRLDSSVDQLDFIRKNWSYISECGASYRSRLFCINAKLEMDIKTLGKMSNTMNEIADIYARADRTVADEVFYYRFKKGYMGEG